jgi:hypothetical protein
VETLFLIPHLLRLLQVVLSHLVVVMVENMACPATQVLLVADQDH